MLAFLDTAGSENLRLTNGSHGNGHAHKYTKIEPVYN